MNKKKHLLFWILFPIIWSVIAFLLVFLFDLSNGPIIWLIIELILLVAFFVVRVLFRDKKLWVRAVTWGGFVVLVVACLAFNKPATAYKKAYYYDNPQFIDEPLVLNEGKVKGVYNEDKSVEIYAGIQYAEAERWKEPQVHTWEGVHDGTKFGPKSMQPGKNAYFNSVIDIYAGKSWHPNLKMKKVEPCTEQGLYLNIWKPNTTETNLPILVFIHGGSLTNGNAAFEDYNGESVAKLGVIMITIQYRLNVFGYFAHPDLRNESVHHTTGNYGLLDQIFALKWINDNASNLGGDKNNITIAGESAGSSSVSAICTSPLATGLFRRAIGESSSLVVKDVPHTYRTEEEAYEVSKSILKEFKCSTIEELRKIPAEKLVETKFKNQEMMLDGYALTKNPYQVYVDGENNEEALLNGYNIKESDAFIIPTYLFSPTNKNNIKDRVASLFNESTAQKICELYKDKIEKDPSGALCEIASVGWFIMPHHTWSNMAIKSAHPVTVYRYQFTKENGFYGTYHSGEMVYAYGNLDKQDRPYAYDESDYKLSNIMLNYWVNFAKTGNPNGAGLPEWKQYTESHEFIMELGEKTQEIPDIYKNLYPILDEYYDSKKAS